MGKTLGYCEATKFLSGAKGFYIKVSPFEPVGTYYTQLLLRLKKLSMPNYKTGNYRRITGYIRQRLGPRDIQPLTTSGNIDDESWIILEYYSEVQNVGLELLKKAGITNSLTRKRTFKHFQAYIRQAKTYYYSAKTLPARSSGLLYYYCFLNLSKAAILLKNPSLGGQFIGHGLSYKINDNSPLSKQVVSLKQNGVFEKFYEWHFGTTINLKKFNIKTLLSYCSDIGYQCEMSGIKEVKIIPAYFVSAVDKTRKTGWGVVGFYDLADVVKYKKSMKPFFNSFELVNIPETTIKEIFGISAYQKARVSFFQSINEKPWLGPDAPNIINTRSEVMTILNKVFQINYFKEDFDFKLSLPYKINRQEQIDELVAIYVIMFYISSLVRYKPAYLESLFDKKEAWLIESFVKSCPITFLRITTSRIVGIDYILDSR